MPRMSFSFSLHRTKFKRTHSRSTSAEGPNAYRRTFSSIAIASTTWKRTALSTTTMFRRMEPALVAPSMVPLRSIRPSALPRNANAKSLKANLWNSWTTQWKIRLSKTPVARVCCSWRMNSETQKRCRTFGQKCKPDWFKSRSMSCLKMVKCCWSVRTILVSGRPSARLRRSQSPQRNRCTSSQAPTRSGSSLAAETQTARKRRVL